MISAFLREADWLIEMGPGAGEYGGRLLCQGTVEDVSENRDSLIGPFLSGRESVLVRKPAASAQMFERGNIHLSTEPLHTVRALELDIPKGRLTAVTGVSGSGKTTLILESLVPALRAMTEGEKLPPHIRQLDALGIRRICLIDAAPIGTNVRSHRGYLQQRAG